MNKIRKVILNPGHGFGDPGAVGVGGIKEADINLSIAARVNDLLKNYMSVIMTRQWGDHASLSQNENLEMVVDIANANKDADLFISNHCNASASAHASGLEVWTKSNGEGFVPMDSKRVAMQTYENIFKYAGQVGYNYSLRGVKPAIDEHSYYVLRKNIHPSILIETGFITNQKDADWLKSGIGQIAISYAIAITILQFGGAK